MSGAGDREHSGGAPRSSGQTPDTSSSSDLERLRELLLGREQRQLREIENHLESLEPSAEQVAGVLPEAVALRTRGDKELARALAPTIESGIKESVYRNPEAIAEAIYPTLGPAIRKAIAQSMSGLVETLNRAIEHSLSWRGFQWRLEAWRTGVPFAEIVVKYALVYQVEQVFLIHRETGLLLAHAAADEAHARDPDLVSAMLTAISDFVTDSFDAAGEGGLRNFSVGDRTVLVEAGPAGLLAAVVRGQAPASLFERLQEALELIHLRFRGSLAEFDGDAARFEAALPILEDCLETVLDSDQGKTRGAAPRVAWAAAALVALALLLLGVRSHLRWRQAVALIGEQPGIVLIEAERGWGGWRLSGLRDPLAPDPLTLLAEHGIDVSGVETTWRPYLSIEPAVLIRRAEETLSPPAGVSLSLDAGVLRCVGAAPPRWIATAAQSAMYLPGVQAVDLSGIEPLVTAELESARQELEGIRVLFELGSPVLAEFSRPSIAAAVESATRLQEMATEEGWVVDMRLVGRTDATGSEETNRLLSEERSETVREAFERRGLDMANVNIVGIGISEPLVADSAEEQAQLNRSVSFSVTLRAEGMEEE